MQSRPHNALGNNSCRHEIKQNVYYTLESRHLKTTVVKQSCDVVLHTKHQIRYIPAMLACLLPAGPLSIQPQFGTALLAGCILELHIYIIYSVYTSLVYC
jgi:hypothetical protein